MREEDYNDGTETEVEGEEAAAGHTGIQIYDPRNPGELISRKDFCRREFGEHGRSRKEIADQLTVIEDNRDEAGNLIPVKYQTVFQYTKDLGGEGTAARSGVRGSPESAAASLAVKAGE